MKNLIYVLILCGFVGACGSAGAGKPELTSLDSFFLENPELLPEEFTMHESWPRIELNNYAIEAAIRNNIKPLLERYRPNSKAIIYASQYDSSTYYFSVVSPTEDVPFDVEWDSDSNIIGTSVVGYGCIDSLYILYGKDIKGTSIDNRARPHEFKLKLLRDIMMDERFEWWVDVYGDSVVSYSYFNCNPISELREKRLIKCLDAMDEHDF